MVVVVVVMVVVVVVVMVVIVNLQVRVSKQRKHSPVNVFFGEELSVLFAPSHASHKVHHLGRTEVRVDVYKSLSCPPGPCPWRAERGPQDYRQQCSRTRRGRRRRWRRWWPWGEPLPGRQGVRLGALRPSWNSFFASWPEEAALGMAWGCLEAPAAGHQGGPG